MEAGGMAKQKRKFDPSRKALVGLYQRYTTYEIGEKYGVSPEIVRRRLHALGIEARKTGPEPFKAPPRAEVNALYQKKSIDGVAKKYGVGYGTVWRWLKQYRISLKKYGNHRQKPRVFTEEHRRRIRLSHRQMAQWGSNNPNFNDYRTQESLRLRRTGLYKEWKKKSLQLRGWKCQRCGVKYGETCKHCGHKTYLHVHHIKSFTDFPSLRFEPKNSEVLCPTCHHFRHSGKSGELGKTLK